MAREDDRGDFGFRRFDHGALLGRRGDQRRAAPRGDPSRDARKQAGADSKRFVLQEQGRPGDDRCGRRVPAVAFGRGRGEGRASALRRGAGATTRRHRAVFGLGVQDHERQVRRAFDLPACLLRQAEEGIGGERVLPRPANQRIPHAYRAHRPHPRDARQRPNGSR